MPHERVVFSDHANERLHERGVTFVVTVYEPDPDQWTDDFRRRIDND